MKETRHAQVEKSRPPYGGSALRASKDPVAPVGTTRHQQEQGDSVPLTPLPECSSVIVVVARL
jgi:hypothetical protein